MHANGLFSLSGDATFSVQRLEFRSGSEFAVDLASTASLGQVSGALSLVDTTLTLSLAEGFSAAAGETIALVNYGSVTGTFLGLADGATLSAGGYSFQINYGTGTADRIQLAVLQTIPEPASIAVSS